MQTQLRLRLTDAKESQRERCQRVLSQVREVRRASELRTFTDAAERACEALERASHTEKKIGGSFDRKKTGVGYAEEQNTKVIS